MLLAPDARVRHAHHLTFTRFWRQHWMYGRGAFHLHAARRRRGEGAMQAEPLSFYVDLIRYPIRKNAGLGGIVEAGLLGVSQLANALGYFSERSSGGGAMRATANGPSGSRESTALFRLDRRECGGPAAAPIDQDVERRQRAKHAEHQARDPRGPA
jgi:hypothetical protein